MRYVSRQRELQKGSHGMKHISTFIVILAFIPLTALRAADEPATGAAVRAFIDDEGHLDLERGSAALHGAAGECAANVAAIW